MLNKVKEALGALRDSPPDVAEAIKILETIIVQETFKQTPVADTSFKMPFGKYKGQSLDEICAEDPGYLHWAAKNLDDGYVTEKIKEYLEENDE